MTPEELHSPPAVIDDVPEGVSRAGGARHPLAQVLDIKEVNTQVDVMMTVDHVPGVGDTVANVYRVANTISGVGGT